MGVFRRDDRSPVDDGVTVVLNVSSVTVAYSTPFWGTQREDGGNPPPDIFVVRNRLRAV